MSVVGIYADGGCMRSNPSPYGGMWAYTLVNEDDWRVAEASGVVLPGDMGGQVVTNNQTEFFALLRGLEAVEPGWVGTIYSDSKLTLARFFAARVRPASVATGHPGKLILRGVPLDGWVGLEKIPPSWAERMREAVWRLGDGCVVQRLDGHPSRAELRTGVGKRGMPVSPHQVWCDDACTRAGAEYMKHLESLKGIAA